MAQKKEGKTDEVIGFHKGALSTLSKERQELIRLLSIVEQLMHAHVAELKKLGVDLAKEIESAKQEKKPIEDILKDNA